MPSFRVTMIIGALRPGGSPAAVLPTAAAAAAELTTVEASDLAVVAGTARATVRFTADDAELAAQIGRHVVDVTSTVAEPISSVVTERVKGRWVPVH
jgi:beta-lactamase class A